MEHYVFFFTTIQSLQFYCIYEVFRCLLSEEIFFWKKLSVNENRRRSQKSKHSTQIVVSSKEQLVSKYIRKNSQEEVCSLALCSKSRNMDYILITSMSMFCQMYHLGKPVLRFSTTVYQKQAFFFFTKKATFQFQSQCNYQKNDDEGVSTNHIMIRRTISSHLMIQL